VGSTENLKIRWGKHKCNYRVWLNSKGQSYTIYPYFKKFGIENFKCEIIKEYVVCDNNGKNAWEQLWINKLKCVNKNFPLKMLLRKQYQQNFMKTYKRDKSNVVCECGETVRKYHLKKHRTRKLHKANMEKL